MTTKSWNFGIDHQSDAGFRAWGADFELGLSDVGLTKTADSGQINWVTVARPGVSTIAGYAIYRFNDASQSSAPIFLKFNFGTDNATTRPFISVEIGTGSNGSGTITGSLETREISAGVGAATGVSQTSYFSYSNGFLGLVWAKNGGTTNVARACMFVCRSVDSNGDPDTHAMMWTALDGAAVYTTTAAETVSTWSCYNFDEADLFTAYNHGGGWMPAGVVNATLNANGDTAAYGSFGVDPHLFPVIGYCGVWISEVAELSTFSTALVGATAHTYICLGESGVARVLFATGESVLAQVGHSMLWE